MNRLWLRRGWGCILVPRDHNGDDHFDLRGIPLNPGSSRHQTMFVGPNPACNPENAWLTFLSVQGTEDVTGMQIDIGGPSAAFRAPYLAGSRCDPAVLQGTYAIERAPILVGGSLSFQFRHLYSGLAFAASGCEARQTGAYTGWSQVMGRPGRRSFHRTRPGHR